MQVQIIDQSESGSRGPAATARPGSNATAPGRWQGARPRPAWPALTAVLLAAVVAAACGGDTGQGSGAGGPASELPVSPPDGPVDERLAEEGERLFRTRGCISCHTIGGGRRVGPDLQGLAERRDFAWTYHMITNPDSMLKNDSIARRLLAEYFTPMADQDVQPEQFRALYEYIRSESQGTADDDGEDDVSSAGGGDARGTAMAHRERRQHRQRQHHGCCGDDN